MLDRVLSHSSEEILCEATLSAAHPYLRERNVDAAISLELMAQSVAAHAALCQRETQPAQSPRIGYIASVPLLEFSGGDFEIGDVLRITATPIHRDERIAQYQARVHTGETLRASGQLSVFLESASPVSASE